MPRGPEPSGGGESFGRWLASELSARRWRQKDLAGRAGTSQQTVSRWLSGATTPSGHHVRALATALGISGDAILERLERERRSRPEPAG